MVDERVVGLHGVPESDPVRQEHTGAMLLGAVPGAPHVHVVSWAEERVLVEAHADVDARLTVAGDPESPVGLEVEHRFVGEHHQSHALEPVDHTLHVDTALAEPIHHALQMRTPLELRFCNPWHVASDYRVEVTLGDRPIMGIRLTGATVATPQPCGPGCEHDDKRR